MRSLSDYPKSDLEFLKGALLSCKLTSNEDIQMGSDWWNRITEAIADRDHEDNLLPQDTTDWKRFTNKE